jgi:hypothetical protein
MLRDTASTRPIPTHDFFGPGRGDAPTSAVCFQPRNRSSWWRTDTNEGAPVRDLFSHGGPGQPNGDGVGVERMHLLLPANASPPTSMGLADQEAGM